MLFGNTLSKAGLAAAGITKQFATRSDQVEYRLVRGATSREATLPLVRDTIRTALTPTINALGVTGIVHIPGMMTGQLLAGQTPSQAASYQIMITFLIATTACTTVQLVVQLATCALVDLHNHRLVQIDWNHIDFRTKNGRPRISKILRLDSGKSKLISNPIDLRKKESLSRTSIYESGRQIMLSSVLRQSSSAAITKSRNQSAEQGNPILEAKSVEVPRTGLSLTMTLHKGNRLGISGRSGIGKSQILRVLAGLDATNQDFDHSGIWFNGSPISEMSMVEYRTNVCLVPQSRPTLEGTPLAFYTEVSQFEHQRRRNIWESTAPSPIDIATPWRLDKSAWTKSWSALSGGEAQRASLAIALATQPAVLLLDESISALDESTSRLVEETLTKSGIPIIFVTHSKEQLNRFCTHQMELIFEENT